MLRGCHRGAATLQLRWVGGSVQLEAALRLSSPRRFWTEGGRTCRPLSVRSLARHPLIGRLKKSLGVRAKPVAVPTQQEFESMSDRERYLWALKLEKVPYPQDPQRTVGQVLLQELISRDHMQAKYTYATLIMTKELEGDPRYALRLWAECSARGHSWAKANLAKVLADGQLIQKDVEGAIRLYTEAWHAAPLLAPNHAFTAAYNLYSLYKQKGDVKRAAKWLKISADQAGDSLGQYHLGLAYSTGILGMEVDPMRAVEYTRKSADQGLVVAQHNVACLYLDGQGGKTTDYPAAAYYFTLAHTRETDWSTLNLAIMYATGKGVPRSEVTCVELLREVECFGNHSQKKAVVEVYEKHQYDQIWHRGVLE
ncbi:uncharacterized protein LOC126320597 [Schistocerca gregaria]|uniref:uncharacterized protein LOC126320597 n=1 Tax=Schistocerca gregaria TaxID=7010 RepID=UPI00211DFBEF|nr:uncharacterized protein LOC126320597 [Schistocerca gregaria]XP_049850024.1 uncharacterized protein LOC126320597 [Schistocerca gregaria]